MHTIKKTPTTETHEKLFFLEGSEPWISDFATLPQLVPSSKKKKRKKKKKAVSTRKNLLKNMN